MERMKDRPTVPKKRGPNVGAAPGFACLEVVAGKDKGRVHPLGLGENLLGRHARARILLEDDGVSRVHAKVIVAADGVLTLSDLRSTNGTFLNGAPVETAILREGDRIAVGPDVILRVTYLADQQLGSGAVDLSPREFEVALLAADGLTNAEIGRRIGLSPHTVMTHLSNIYRRLGLRSRAELAKFMGEARAST